MATQVQFRGGTTVEHSTFTGASREITIDTTKDTVVVHDGSTAGGHPLATEDGATLTNVDINSGTIDGTTIGGTTPAAITGTTITATGNVVVTGTVDGRDVAADGTKLDGIAAGADVTDTANVTAAGALMDSELTNITAVKAMDQGVATTDSPTFAGATITGNVSVDGGTIKLDGNYPVGSGNVALGNAALDDASLSGANNTAVGSAALSANTTGGQNTAVGDNALALNTTGGRSTAVGYWAARQNTASYITAIGFGTLTANTTGANNTAVGYQAAYNNTSGTRLAALGYQALYANTTGNYNTAVGYAALDANTTASYNTALGHFALSSLVGGGATLNTAIGSDAMANTTTGTNNVAVGSSALASNTTASENTAVGYQAGYSNTTSGGNTYVGKAAGYYTTGVSNTLIGQAAGSNITTGAKNTIIGRYNGNQGGLDIRTSNNYIVLSDGDGNPRVVVDSSGNVGIGTSSPQSPFHINVGTDQNLRVFSASGTPTIGSLNDANSAYTALGYTGSQHEFRIGPTERMRIDSSGNLLVGTTTTALGSASGAHINPDGYLSISRSGAQVAYFNRLTSDGTITEFRKDGATVGSIGTIGSDLYLNTGSTGLRFFDQYSQIIPCGVDGASIDDAVDLGRISVRFDDIYATNGTIQTSDRNEKQDIDVLSDAEQRVAVAAKGLLRKFRWKNAVAEKGDEARIHFGIIAQDLQAAFEAEGLDAGRYAMFIHSTWTDEETGEEKSRMGVRYSELLAFIIAAL